LIDRPIGETRNDRDQSSEVRVRSCRGSSLGRLRQWWRRVAAAGRREQSAPGHHAVFRRRLLTPTIGDAALRSSRILSRRGVLNGLTVAGGTVAAGLARSAWAEVVSGQVPVRQDIANLTPKRLASLEAAIGEMQRRSKVNPDDPAGWRVHAWNHALVCAVVPNTDDAQVHGCWWFLPWHRAFLAVTEMKLRAISGEPDLVLPYWNWSSDRTIPAPFSRPGSPLAQAVRYTPNRPLQPAEVDRLSHDPALARLGVAALGADVFQADSSDDIPASFGGIAKPNPDSLHGRNRLEGIPHTAIHNYVGGEQADGSLGDMTELATAGLDPIFYAHHANLDRLWERWRRDPRRKATEPSAAEFTQKTFFFPWLDGTFVTMSVGDLLDIGRLGYAYDSLSVFRDGTPPAGDDAPIDLSRQPLAVETLQVPAGALSHAPATGRCMLRISGVLPTQRPVTAEVVVAAAGDPGSAVVVGAISGGRRHSRPSGFPDTEPRFDVTAAVKRLATPTVVVSVLPLSLGPDLPGPPAFTHGGMSIAIE